MFTLLATCTLALGCRDSVGSEGGRPQFSEGAAATVAIVRCEGDPQTRELVCTAVEPHGFSTSQGPAKAIVGNPDVQLSSYNVAYDTTTLIFSFDAKVKNQLTEAIGTPNGTTVTGLKVYYETGPSATSYYSPGDTGTVAVNNPDGIGHFTKANQPYHFYNELVTPNDTTDRKRWELRIPRAVKTFAFQVRVFTARPSEVPVPTTSVDTTPSWFWARTHDLPCTGLMVGRCLRNVVQVAFKGTATQEQKQAAFDAIRGVSVGGVTGIFFVQIPDDTTVVSLRNALALLRGLPQVAFASPYSTEYLTPEYLTPTDGTGWNTWELKPANRNGSNWALEMINAPMAWGCSWGDSTTAVAAVDAEFHNVTDLNHANGTNAAFGVVATSRDHGTRVAGIMGGRGDNSTQVTGLMWRSSLRLYDTSNGGTVPAGGSDPDAMIRGILQAARGNAKVINLSVGIRWNALRSQANYDPDLETDTTKDRENRAYRASNYQRVAAALQTLQSEGRDFLLVMSAGNEPIDARWNFGRDAADSANNVIVVGAVNRVGALSSFSARGTAVRLLAPGQGVGVVRGNNTTDTIGGSGSSFAAPHVSGVAGLLEAFDPRLTADSIRTILIAGADRTLSSSGIPVVDAYQSLRLAAARRGAPLCGNRMWVTGGYELVVERGAAEDTIASPVYSVHRVNHGGRAAFVDGAGSNWVVYTPGSGWSQTSTAPVDHQPQPQHWSSNNGGSHDGLYLYSSWYDHSGGYPVDGLVRVIRQDSLGNNGIDLSRGIPGYPASAIWSPSRWVSLGVAVSPLDDEVLFLVADSVSPASSVHLWRRPLPSGTATLLWADVAVGKSEVGISEDGGEVMVSDSFGVRFHSRGTGAVLRTITSSNQSGGFSPSVRAAAQRRTR